MFHYRFLQGSIKCKIPFPTIKCFLVKSTAVHFFFFLRAWHSLKQFYEDFSVAATEEQYITWQKEESIFYLPARENGVKRAKLIVELRGLKTLVDLGEQQADNSPKPSAAATTILVVWSKYRQDLLARRPNKAHQSSTKIHRWGSCWKTFVSKQKKSSSYHQLFYLTLKGRSISALRIAFYALIPSKSHF